MKTALFDRFAKYVKVNTQSDEESTAFPSSPGQLELGKMLAEEMKKIGLTDVEVDQFGYVFGTLSATSKKKTPTLAFLAHMDTSPEASGENVIPQIHKNYNGGTIVINQNEKLMLQPDEYPSLKKCTGHDIVTASGHTLLGADNKAGIAIILTAIEHLIKNPQIPHGPIRVAFTPDEEVGRGVDHFDVKKLNAQYAYTFDGDVLGAIEDETFNADGLTIQITGRSVHPGSAKDSMANAVRIASDIITSWPENHLPETTENYDGFIGFMQIQGSIENATIKGIIREHDLKKLRKLEEHLIAIVEEKKIKYPLAKIEVQIKEQYRNMKEKINEHPQVMKHLVNAIKKQGIEPHLKPVRGGTDGARLSFMGLPTPNVFTGGSNYHGRLEWVSLDDMEKSTKVLIQLVQEWEKNEP